MYDDFCILLGKHEKSLNVEMKHGKKYQYEVVQSAIIANHILSKLVPNEEYILSAGPFRSKLGLVNCPCQVESCDAEIKFGTTSIGKYLKVNLSLLCHLYLVLKLKIIQTSHLSGFVSVGCLLVSSLSFYLSKKLGSLCMFDMKIEI